MFQRVRLAPWSRASGRPSLGQCSVQPLGTARPRCVAKATSCHSHTLPKVYRFTNFVSHKTGQHQLRPSWVSNCACQHPPHTHSTGTRTQAPPSRRAQGCTRLYKLLLGALNTPQPCTSLGCLFSWWCLNNCTRSYAGATPHSKVHSDSGVHAAAGVAGRGADAHVRQHSHAGAMHVPDTLRHGQAGRLQVCQPARMEAGHQRALQVRGGANLPHHHHHIHTHTHTNHPSLAMSHCRCKFL